MINSVQMLIISIIAYVQKRTSKSKQAFEAFVAVNMVSENQATHICEKLWLKVM